MKETSIIIRRKNKQRRDFLFEGIKAPNCVICGIGIKRSVFRTGGIQAISVWLKRKVCAGVGREKSPCGIELHRRMSNRNLTPFCSDCGIKISYRTKNDKKVKSGLCYECIKKTGFFNALGYTKPWIAFNKSRAMKAGTIKQSPAPSNRLLLS